MTETGKGFTEEHATAKARLEELQNKCARAITQGVSTGSPSSSEGVTGAKHVYTDSLGTIELNEDISDLTTDIVIGEQAHVAEEQAHIAIKSDKRRDLSSPDYDMSILPATYKEAIQ